MHNKFDNLLSLIPGLTLCIAISAPAWFLGQIIPIIGGPVFSIAGGVIIASVFKQRITKSKFDFTSGIKFSSKKILQSAIVLLGFGMSMQNILMAGTYFPIILAGFASALLCAFVMGKVLKLAGNTRTLIGVGTAICGGSAIVAAAPIIKAKDEEVAQAISTVFLFNIIAVLLFPLIGCILGMDDAGFGIWAGAAINDTSSVAAAGASWSASAGNETAIQYAAVIKVSRTLMIIPTTLVLAFVSAGKQKKPGVAGFRISKIFPWFVAFFFAAALANTFLNLPISSELSIMGRFMITVSMAGIGLNTDIRLFSSSGLKPILLGMLCWAAIVVVSLMFLL